MTETSGESVWVRRTFDDIDSVVKTRSRYVSIKVDTAFQGYVGKCIHLAMTYKDSKGIVYLY